MNTAPRPRDAAPGRGADLTAPTRHTPSEDTDMTRTPGDTVAYLDTLTHPADLYGPDLAPLVADVCALDDLGLPA